MTRHPLDIVSLMAGLLFAGLGVGFLLEALDVWSTDVSWVPPIVLIVLGLAGVLSTVARQPARRDYDDHANMSRNSAGATDSSCA